jgi:hypothetical protein
MAPVFLCVICSKVLDLTIDLNTDDNGKAIHEQCYVNRLISKGERHHGQFLQTHTCLAWFLPILALPAHIKRQRTPFV